MSPYRRRWFANEKKIREAAEHVLRRTSREPALWNIVVFYILALELGPLWAFLLIVALAVATFAPLKWLHPFRVRRLRPATR